MNTIADNLRSANDLGQIRFSLKFLNRPTYNFKGSFVVCRNDVERVVSYDHGLEGSIAEDAYFAIKASNLGYTFDWVDGEVCERSPFTFMDLVRQRRRWAQGLHLMAVSTNLERDFTGRIFQ